MPAVKVVGQKGVSEGVMKALRQMRTEKTVGHSGLESAEVEIIAAEAAERIIKSVYGDDYISK